MKTFRADLLQPEAAVHHTSSPGPRAQPVRRLHVLAGQVALGVEDGLGLAGGAARERDQARLVLAQLDRRGGLAREQRLVGHEHDLAPRLPAASSSARLRSSATISRGRATSMRRRRSLARSCSVHGSTTAPMRMHAHIVITHSGRLPISVITTSPLLHAPRAQRAGQTRAAIGDLAERPLAPRPVPGQLHQRAVSRRQSIEHVAGEVHGRSSAPGA